MVFLVVCSPRRGQWVSEGWERPPRSAGSRGGSVGPLRVREPPVPWALPPPAAPEGPEGVWVGWGLQAMAPTPAVSLAPWGQLLRVGKAWVHPPHSLDPTSAPGALFLLLLLSPSSLCPRLCSLSRVSDWGKRNLPVNHPGGFFSLRCALPPFLSLPAPRSALLFHLGCQTPGN